MTTKFAIAFTIVLISMLSCNNNDSKNTKNETSTSGSSNDSNLYFDFTIDGKEMRVDAEDISSTYTESADTSLLIFAGKGDGPKISLAIPYLLSKPSTTPSGSIDPSSKINHGSIELSNYPEKNYTSRSHDGVYPEKTPILPDAIVVTSSEKQGEDATIITGTFNAKTYSHNKETDPKNTDHNVKGKFRIKHKSSDSHMLN